MNSILYLKKNKTVIKFLISNILFLLFFCFFTKNVYANNINEIDMDIYIDKNGNANITEVWDAYLNQGTEGYRAYNKLGNSSISNFLVSDETGKTYDNLSYWNTNSDFNSKSYKSGLNILSNGVELC